MRAGGRGEPGRELADQLAERGDRGVPGSAGPRRRGAEHRPEQQRDQRGGRAADPGVPGRARAAFRAGHAGGRVVRGPDRARARAGVPRPGPGPYLRRGDHRGIPGVRDCPGHHRGTRNRPPGRGHIAGRHDHRGLRAAAHPVPAGRGGWPGRPMAAGVGAARMEHRPAVAAQPHLLRSDSGLRHGQRPAPDPDRPAGHRAGRRAADRPVDADRRGQLPGRRARGRAGCPGSDLRHRHPVPVPGRRRGRRDDRHAGAAVLQHQRP